jgi:hypothetical protein
LALAEAASAGGAAAATLFCNRAECSRQLGAHAATVADATAALAAAPGHAKALLRRALALEAMDRHAEALAGAPRPRPFASAPRVPVRVLTQALVLS